MTQFRFCPTCRDNHKVAAFGYDEAFGRKPIVILWCGHTVVQNRPFIRPTERRPDHEE